MPNSYHINPAAQEIMGDIYDGACETEQYSFRFWLNFRDDENIQVTEATTVNGAEMDFDQKNAFEDWVEKNGPAIAHEAMVLAYNWIADTWAE